MPKRFDSKKFREVHGFADRQEMADKVGVTTRTIQHWDAGTRRPSPLALKQLRQLEVERKKKASTSSSSSSPSSSSPSSPSSTSSSSPGTGPVRQGFIPSSH